ncbi:hypothetical protein MLD38_030218 [Melastoma candidum]|uniref:Uncharacterized protein n=1 Tax=Melastoma candidum TaxID=119954 RepID=A0ACB9MM88_9MYRT|nr:hypothetical protein MLD38_030218 [Melastoma candidum]
MFDRGRERVPTPFRQQTASKKFKKEEKKRHRNISRSRPKSGRKPLREIHVSGVNVPSTDAQSKPRKNIAPDSTPSYWGSAKGEQTTWRDGIDRLLLVTSELGGVVGEIDELVAQAFQLKTISKCGKEEAEALSAFLSEILSSLKPWSSRLKSACLPAGIFGTDRTFFCDFSLQSGAR